jgi:hypothetical protein
MEKKWLKEALFGGMTINAFKLGTVLSLGWFWQRTAGCSVLYRGSSMETIDFDSILTVDALSAKQIQPPQYLPHLRNMVHFYVVRRTNGCGDLERTLSATVKVSTDGNGDLEQPRPNSIFEAGAEQLSGGKVKLFWFYCPIDQDCELACFNIYYDNCTGQVDYENPIASVCYTGRKFYSYQSGLLEGGRYLFAIRANGVKGIEDNSLAELAIQITIHGADSVYILGAEAI